MSEIQSNEQTATARRYRAGVAKRLDLILSEVQDLRGAIQQVLAEREHEQQQET
jgi:hypothetical protein